MDNVTMTVHDPREALEPDGRDAAIVHWRRELAAAFAAKDNSRFGTAFAELKKLYMAWPCCSHCCGHSGPWFGSETLVVDVQGNELGHTEPCAQCQAPLLEENG